MKEKLEFIVRATYQHAKNLAMLAIIYKTVTHLFEKLTGRVHPLQKFIAAFAGGYLVFGENNSVNMQVRVLVECVLVCTDNVLFSVLFRGLLCIVVCPCNQDDSISFR